MSDQDNDIGNEVDEFSLADLAGLDTTDIAEVRFENLPGGSYIFAGTDVKLEKTKNRDDEDRFKLTIGLEVAEVKAVTERGVDKEGLVGKKHKESFYIVPAKAEEGIGLIRAFYADVGLPNAGAIGAAETPDGEPIEGFADGIVGHNFPAKIVRVARKDDPSTKDSRLRLK
jgi:hypothetical protein